MRFAVESWSPEYGAPFEDPGEDDGEPAKVDVTIEMPADAWRPMTPRMGPANSVLFIDGVQQIDARVWSMGEDGLSRPGHCVSMGAGSVRCDGSARVEQVEIRRAMLGTADFGDIDCRPGVMYTGLAVADLTPAGLDTALRRHREDLEVRVAHAAGSADLVVVDGHVRQRETIAGAVGYLKTHQRMYLEQPQLGVVGQLAAGQRTPVFLIAEAWDRYSWYLKLPGGEGHPWAGVVRCEASASLRPADAIAFADLVSATLPRFASAPYKDPRAPQNLYPIAALERELRRRLGDRTLLLRSLQKASHLS